jgi:hypothetical protein
VGWLSDVSFVIRDVGDRVAEAAAVVGVPAGPGFTLDRDEAKVMLEQCKQTLIDLKKLQNTAATLTRIIPPARDQVTVGYHGNLTAQQNGQPAAFAYGAGHVQLEIDYMNELITRLEDALGIMHSSDVNAQKTVEAAGQGSGGYLNGAS